MWVEVFGLIECSLSTYLALLTNLIIIITSADGKKSCSVILSLMRINVYPKWWASCNLNNYSTFLPSAKWRVLV